MAYILFIFGFYILIKGANLLIDGAVSIASRLNISHMIIGLTVVAFGTSMPELVVNVFASIYKSTDIAIGNVIGSNISNILLILGISSIIYPIKTKKDSIFIDMLFSILACIVVGILANDLLIDKKDYSAITRIDGLILISFFIIFLYYIFEKSKSTKHNNLEEIENIKHYSISRSIIYVIIGIIGLGIGGQWIVDGAIYISKTLNINESFIGLTLIAVGTSLPELATSAIAAYKKHTDIAIGNVVGSNIFNIFWVLGFSAIITPLPFTDVLNTDLIIVTVISLLLLIFMYIGKKYTIEKWKGIIMLVLYITYIFFLSTTRLTSI